MMRNLVLAAVAAAVLAAGAGNALADPVRGFGRDVPMATALRQIVPDGWSVSYGVGVDSARHVNWRGGDDWRQVLEGLAGKMGLVVSYQDEARTVRVTRAGDQRAQPDPVRSTRGGFVMVPVRNQAVEGAAAGGAAGGPAVGAWVAVKDRPLRSVLAEWGERAGWSVVWNSGFEYRLQAGATFGGDFIQASGDLLRSLQQSKGPAVVGTFYKGNRTLVIANDNAGAN